MGHGMIRTACSTVWPSVSFEQTFRPQGRQDPAWQPPSKFIFKFKFQQNVFVIIRSKGILNHFIPQMVPNSSPIITNP